MKNNASKTVYVMVALASLTLWFALRLSLAVSGIVGH
jgi:hypothetical protein